MKRFIALTIAVAAALAGCSAEPTDPGTAGDQSQSESQSAELHPMGTPVEAPGVTLSVDDVTVSDSIELYADGFKRGTQPNETVASEKGEFVSVTTTVKNTGQAPLDLTCGFGIQAELFNSDNQYYEPQQKLYRVIDNPDCSDYLGPGFDTQMTWVFEVPTGTTLGAFGFADPETHYDDLTFIDLAGAA